MRGDRDQHRVQRADTQLQLLRRRRLVRGQRRPHHHDGQLCQPATDSGWLTAGLARSLARWLAGVLSASLRRASRASSVCVAAVARVPLRRPTGGDRQQLPLLLLQKQI